MLRPAPLALGIFGFLVLVGGLMYVALTREPPSPIAEPLPAPKQDVQEQTQTARAVIERGIEAVGGEALVTKFPAGVASGKHRVHFVDKAPLEESFEWHFHKPDKQKWVFRLGFDKQPARVESWNKSAGWQKFDEVRPLPPERLQLETYMQEIVGLVAILKDDGYRLGSPVAAEDNGRKHTRLTVAKDKMPEIGLYFDDQTGRLSKCEMISQAPAGMEPASTEINFTNYKEVQGAQVPMKSASYLVRGANKSLLEELVFEQWQPLESLPAATFARPE